MDRLTGIRWLSPRGGRRLPPRSRWPRRPQSLPLPLLSGIAILILALVAFLVVQAGSGSVVTSDLPLIRIGLASAVSTQGVGELPTGSPGTGPVFGGPSSEIAGAGSDTTEPSSSTIQPPSSSGSASTGTSVGGGTEGSSTTTATTGGPTGSGSTTTTREVVPGTIRGSTSTTGAR